MNTTSINCETYIRLKGVNFFLVGSDYSIQMWGKDNIYSIIRLNPEPINIKEFADIKEFEFSDN